MSGEIDWEEVNAEFESSGEKLRDFCERRGLSFYSFRSRRRHFMERNREADTFVEYALQTDGGEHEYLCYEIKTLSGRELRIRRGFCVVEVRQLLSLCE